MYYQIEQPLETPPKLSTKKHKFRTFSRYVFILLWFFFCILNAILTKVVFELKKKLFQDEIPTTQIIIAKLMWSVTADQSFSNQSIEQIGVERKMRGIANQKCVADVTPLTLRGRPPPPRPFNHFFLAYCIGVLSVCVLFAYPPL